MGRIKSKKASTMYLKKKTDISTVIRRLSEKQEIEKHDKSDGENLSSEETYINGLNLGFASKLDFGRIRFIISDKNNRNVILTHIITGDKRIVGTIKIGNKEIPIRITEDQLLQALQTSPTEES